jgi:hypothetical protein
MNQALYAHMNNKRKMKKKKIKRLTNQYDNNIIIINKVLPSGQIKILL